METRIKEAREKQYEPTEFVKQLYQAIIFRSPKRLDVLGISPAQVSGEGLNWLAEYIAAFEKERLETQ